MDRQVETTTGVEQNLTQQRINEANRMLDAQIAQIEANNSRTAEQKSQARMNVAKDLLRDLIESNAAREIAKKQMERGEDVPREVIKTVLNNTHEKYIDVVIAARKGLEVGKSAKSQLLLIELSKTIPSIEQTAEIMDKVGAWVVGEKNIIFSNTNIPSDFEQAINRLKESNYTSAKILVDALARQAATYGLSETEIRERFEIEGSGITPEVEQFFRASGADPEDHDLGDDWARAHSLYASKFSKEQIKFLKIFYSPKRFKDYAMREKGLIKNNKSEVNDIRRSIKTSYTDIYKRAPTEAELEGLVNDKIIQDVSQNIGRELAEIVDQLYLRLQKEKPHKIHGDIESEDPFYGIMPTKLAIKAALQKINLDIGNLIKSGDSSYEDLGFAIRKEKKNFVQERAKLNEDGVAVGMLPYLRNIPMPYFKNVGVNDFLNNLAMNFDHRIHRDAYLHNVRAIFNRPVGKEGFYAGLGEYAEELSGTDIDEMMSLPDGNLVYQAYVLYDKIVDEQFALQDWHHRPDQFTNKYEEYSTELEQEVIDRLVLKTGDRYTMEQIIAAKNAVVGMANGVFLTGPEKSSYADPTTVEGKGLVSSYGTGDAGPLNGLNCLHTIMRWQGEGLMNPIFFMPLHGEKSWIRDHKVMFGNMKKYLNSYSTNENGELPEDLFIDYIPNIGKAAGPAQRRGWRMEYPLDGHLVYEDSEFPNKKGEMVKSHSINYLKSFKAMDVLGYEALHDFMNNRLGGDKGMLKALNGDSFDKKNELFNHIYKKYFVSFGEEASYDNYMKELRKEGEKKVLENFKGNDARKKNVLLAGSFEAQVELETSKIFINRFLAREVAARFPTKFMRIDKNRLNEDGISKWTHIYNQMKKKDPNLSRDDFDHIMKDLTFAEMLLRNKISEATRTRLEINNDLTLDQVADSEEVNLILNESTIRRLFKEEIKVKGGMPEDRVQKVIDAYKMIRSEFYEVSSDKNRKYSNFLDVEAIKMREKYTLTFGLEDTDFTLMSFRKAGPRMIPRMVKDVASIERDIVPEIIDIGNILKSMAVNGGDYNEIIKYLLKTQKTLRDVNGSPDDYEFTYKIATLVINYFKKDTLSKPLFGLFKVGQFNSMASEYAGRNSAVAQWDSRQISNFITALESYHLIPKSPYNLTDQSGSKRNIWGKTVPDYNYVDIWLINPFTKKPFNTHFKKIKVDWEYNGDKLRREHGGNAKSILFDYVTQFGPVVAAMLMAKFIKDAIDEMMGKKK